MAIDVFCYVTLEDGGLIIGWIGLIISSSNIVKILPMKFEVVNIQHENKPELGTLVPITRILYVILLILYILQMVASIFLIHGVHKRNHRYLIPQLVMHVLEFGFMGCEYFINFRLMINIFATELLEHLCGVVFSNAIFVYFFLCMYALYQRFKREEFLSLENRHEMLATCAQSEI